MALLQRILTSLTLLLISTMIQALEFKNYTKNWSSKAGYVFFKSNDFDTPDNSILYASCRIESGLENFHCDIIVDSPTQVETCNLEFQNSDLATNDTYLFILDLRRISGNKIFITYLLENMVQNMTIMRVDVLNRSDCSMTELVENTIKSYDDEISPVIYNNTFDIFVSNNSLCGDYQSCKISYDQTGKQMNISTPFLINMKEGEVIPIALATPLKGFFVNGYNDLSILEVKYINPKGEVKTLIKESLQSYDFFNSRISSAHEMGSICYSNKELKSYCLQFDSNGEMLANISIKIEKNEILRGSYNVGKGQMLVFTEPVGRNWTVRKITAQIQEKPLDLDFTCNALLPLHYKVIIKETNDQFIFYLTCMEESVDSESIDMKYSAQYVSKKFMLNMPQNITIC